MSEREMFEALRERETPDRIEALRVIAETPRRHEQAMTELAKRVEDRFGAHAHAFDALQWAHRNGLAENPAQVFDTWRLTSAGTEVLRRAGGS